MNLVRLFAILGCIGLHCAPLRAADADPVKEKLDAAKAAFQAKLEKLNDGIIAGLQKREDDARKAKLDKLIDQIKAERDEFQKKGAVPKAQNPYQFAQNLKQARADLLVAYDVAIKTYAKDAAKDDVRKAVTKERDALAAEHAATTAGPFHEGSIWTGSLQPNKGKIEVCTFEVTDLSGMDFTATLKTTDTGRVIVIKGKFIRGGIDAKVTEIQKGGQALADAKTIGTVRGNALEAQMTANKAIWTLSLKYTPGK